MGRKTVKKCEIPVTKRSRKRREITSKKEKRAAIRVRDAQVYVNREGIRDQRKGRKGISKAGGSRDQREIERLRGAKVQVKRRGQSRLERNRRNERRESIGKTEEGATLRGRDAEIYVRGKIAQTTKKGNEDKRGKTRLGP